MIRQNQKRRPAKTPSRWGLSPSRRMQILLVCGVTFLGVWLFEATGLVNYFRMTTELTRMKQEIKELERINQALAEEIHRIETDPLALERLARERLGYVRQGETVYQLVETP